MDQVTHNGSELLLLGVASDEPISPATLSLSREKRRDEREGENRREGQGRRVFTQREREREIILFWGSLTSIGVEAVEKEEIEADEEEKSGTAEAPHFPSFFHSRRESRSHNQNMGES